LSCNVFGATTVASTSSRVARTLESTFTGAGKRTLSRP
jgi:hypothetical protein